MNSTAVRSEGAIGPGDARQRLLSQRLEDSPDTRKVRVRFSGSPQDDSSMVRTTGLYPVSGVLISAQSRFESESSYRGQHCVALLFRNKSTRIQS